GRRRRGEVEPPLGEAQLLDLVVDVADRTLLEAPDRAPLVRLAREQGGQRRPYRVDAAREDRRAVGELDRAAVEVAPLEPFDDDRVAREPPRGHVVVVDPDEVDIGQVAIADAHLETRAAARGGRDL